MFTDLVKEKIPFTVLPNDVVQQIKSPMALGLWCYLMSLPDKWEVNRQHLMNHFEIGRDRLDTVLKWLIDHKLIEYIWVRNTKGLVEKVTLHVKNGKDFLNYIKNQNLDTTGLKSLPLVKPQPVDNSLSTTLKNHSVDNPLSGESAPIKEIINTSGKDEKEKSNIKHFFKFIDDNAPYVQGNSAFRFLDKEYDNRLIGFRNEMYQEYKSGIEKGIPHRDLLNRSSKNFIGKKIVNFLPDRETQRKLLLDNTEAILKEGKPQRNPGESQADFLKRTLYK